MPNKDRYGKYGPLNDREEVENDGQNTETPSASATGGEPATTAPAATEAPATAATGDGGEEYRGLTSQIKSMEDAIALMRQRRDEIDVEDAEKRQQRERRESARSFVGSVADLGRALANLHYTTQYAPSQKIGEGLSGKYRELYETKAKERDKDRALWDNYNAQLRKLEEAKGGAEAALDAARQNQRNWVAEQEAKERARQDALAVKAAEREAAKDKADKDREAAKERAEIQAQGRVNAAVAAQREKNRAWEGKYKEYTMPDGTVLRVSEQKLADDVNISNVFAKSARRIDIPKRDANDNIMRDANGNIEREWIERPKGVTKEDEEIPPQTRKQMEEWIGRCIAANHQETIDAMYQLAGQERQQPQGGTVNGTKKGYTKPNEGKKKTYTK